MSLSSPANIAGTFNATSYNNGNSSGSIRYEYTHVNGASPAPGRYYYQVYIGTSTSSNDENNWVYFNTTDNKWYDHGEHDPATFTVQGGSASDPSSEVSANDTIVLRDGSGPVFTFTHPSWLLGTSGGGGGASSDSESAGDPVLNSTGSSTQKKVFSNFW